MRSVCSAWVASAISLAAVLCVLPAFAEPVPGEDAVPAEQAVDVQALQQENQRLRREIKRLQDQVAGDAAIDADNRELRYELMRLRTERDRLRQDADELKSLRYRARWGGLLFLIGLALGYGVAVRRARRRMDREMGRL